MRKEMNKSATKNIDDLGGGIAHPERQGTSKRRRCAKLNGYFGIPVGSSAAEYKRFDRLAACGLREKREEVARELVDRLPEEDDFKKSVEWLLDNNAGPCSQPSWRNGSWRIDRKSNNAPFYQPPS